jgi:hypothetical protein
MPYDVRMPQRLLDSCLAWVALSFAPLAGALAVDAPAGGDSVKVFILAGQSNMEGQAVVDLVGENAA